MGMENQSLSWELIWIDSNGRRTQSKHLDKSAALQHAISIKRQKFSLIQLNGPNEKIDGSALNILLDELNVNSR